MAHHSITAQAEQDLAYQDFGEMLQNFHSVQELSNFAERNGLSTDEQVIERLHEIMNEDYYYQLVNQPGLAEIKNFTDAGELVEHADRYGLIDHPEVLNRLEFIISNTSLKPSLKSSLQHHR